MNKKECIFLFAVLLYFISSAALGNALPAFHPRALQYAASPCTTEKQAKK